MIIKLINRTNFAQIPNKTLRDKRLSLEARGMLAEILSYSSEFETSVESLLKLLDVGRQKLLRITNELKVAGYLEIVNIRGRAGQIIDKEWRFYAESQELDFRPNIVRKQSFSNYQNPNQESLFDDEILSDQDAGFAYVGKNRTSGNPHHHYLNTDSSQNTDLKDLEKLSLSQTDKTESERPFKKSNEVINKSQFSLAEITKYVQLLINEGANIPNPAGYAFVISKSSDSDYLILAKLYPERLNKIALENYGPPRQFSSEPCSVCFGSKWEKIEGKGHRKCLHCQNEKGNATGFEPLESYRQKGLDWLRSELENGEDISRYADFYSEENWQWLMDNLKNENSS